MNFLYRSSIYLFSIVFLMFALASIQVSAQESAPEPTINFETPEVSGNETIDGLSRPDSDPLLGARIGEENAPSIDAAEPNVETPIVETIEPVYTLKQKTLELQLEEVEEETDEYKMLQLPLDKLAQLPEDLQEELLAESAKARYHCAYNLLLARFYDCDCYSVRFLDARIDRGPELSFSTILNKTDNGYCVSDTKAAGYAYSRCLKLLYINNLSDEELENTCACTGRTLAEKLKERPTNSMTRIDYLFTENMIDCRKAARSTLVNPDYE